MNERDNVVSLSLHPFVWK